MQEEEFGRDKMSDIINTTKLAKMSVYEVKYLREKIERVLQGNMHNQFAFHVMYEPQRQRIEALYKELLPYSDEEITSHIVRK